MLPLPIDAVLGDVRRALREADSLVIQAPPGAGKTTRVPLALLEEPWAAGRRLVLLEPRRLAARAAAYRMAALLGEALGETVGYRTRLDTRVGPETRLEVVTEGVLTRMLQFDPSLEGVALVLFDEFHERSLHADLGLALCLHARELLRPDLRLVAMSATLDGERVAELLGGAPIVTADGRVFPVETVQVARPREQRIEDAVAAAVRRALDRHEGDVLAFLPGAAEIARTAARLENADLPAGTHVLALHGSLSREAQQAAIESSPPGRRKVVLATSIAETSLTIEGVHIVIDGGLMRVPRFSPRTGMTRLETVRVTRDAADQRRGRAGRTSPGVCYRLWSEADDAGLLPRRTPEILDADLAPLALELAAWGVADPGELRWLDPPPAAAFAQARALLRELGAVDDNGVITAHGRRMAGLPAHPRLAHMILRARDARELELACTLAALLEERDILKHDDAPSDPDVRLRLDALRRLRASRHGAGVDTGAARRVLDGAAQLLRRVSQHASGGGEAAAGRAERTSKRDARSTARDAAAEEVAARRAERARTRDARSTAWDAAADDAAAGLLLAFAYPDRIARRRPDARGRFLVRNGRGATLPASSVLANEEYIVAAQLGGAGTESTVWLAAPLAEADLRAHFADRIVTDDSLVFDDSTRAARAIRRERLGALVLAERPWPDPPADAVAAALLDGVRRLGVDALPWNGAANSTRERLRFLHTLDAQWPDTSDAALLADLETWLGPALAGRRSLRELGPDDLARALLLRVPPALRSRFDALAPTHITVPSGSRLSIDYADPAAPALAVRLQEVFGWAETPRIAGGRVPLTLRLLSPAHRPVQVTRDLASFWRSGYFDVRKDLRGRYPKHYWPDDPLTATPTRRARPR